MYPAFAASELESFIQFQLNGSAGPDVDESPYGLGSDRRRVTAVPPDAARSIYYATIAADGDDIWIDPDYNPACSWTGLAACSRICLIPPRRPLPESPRPPLRVSAPPLPPHPTYGSCWLTINRFSWMGEKPLSAHGSRCWGQRGMVGSAGKARSLPP